MGISPHKSGEAIPLGDVSLLSMEMSHCAKFWGIDCPIQKRDRKSGARKRSQQDTERERLSGIAI